VRSHPGVPVTADPPLRIVLVEPEIPGNTGSIGRLAMATRCPLHLVEPLGFKVDDRHLRRAGLDYWKSAEIYYHDSFAALLDELGTPPFHLLSSHGTRPYTVIPFHRGDLLVFGRETVGLDPDLLARHADRIFRIPMWNEARSLNVANAVSIVLYEGLRQLRMF
jgi:tRNA (cytidine/uridine-2'-O-)-methyltransferase